MVHIMSVGEKLDKATGLMGEAKSILEKPEVRQSMIIKSPLGELTELNCYKIGKAKAEEAVKILQENNGVKLGEAELILDDINKKIEKMTAPPKPKTKPKPKKKKTEKKPDIQVTLKKIDEKKDKNIMNKPSSRKTYKKKRVK